MAGETTGWGLEFHLHNGTALTELVGVFNVTIPNETADDVEITNYKSPGRRREYIRGLIESGEFQVEMNYVPNSATDVLARAALTAGDTRAFKIVIPDDDGNGFWDINGNGYAKGYERGVPLDDRLTAALTIKVSGATTEAAHV